MFQGDKHDVLPQTVYESRCQGQLAGWLASLTLEDEERLDFDLPQVVCEYVDVFPDELPGLPPQRVVDFGIKLHPDTSPISRLRIGWHRLSYRNSESNYRSYWTRGS